MSKLFETTTINGMKLSNRFVRSATWEGMADAIHQHGGRIAVQLVHAGILSNPKVTGLTPLILSKVVGYAGSEGREMTVDDIQEIIEEHGQAARRVKDAGFDTVQIHGAHGFLINQFLSPAFNKRTDEYGGLIENRTKAAIEIIERVRSYVGDDYPVLFKLNSEDVIDGGLVVEDSLQASLLIQEARIDAIELSGGTVVTGDHALYCCLILFIPFNFIHCYRHPDSKSQHQLSVAKYF